MSTSAPRSASAIDAGDPARVGDRGQRALRGVEVVAVAVHDAARVDHDDVAGAPPAMSIGATATPAAPAPLMTTRRSPSLRSSSLRGVAQRGEHDDRRTVLVVVEDRDRQRRVQPALDLEAARGRDVLEVDPAEAGRQRGDGAR